MNDSPDSDFAQLTDRLRGITDLSERYSAIREAERKFKALMRLHLAEVAQGLKDEGRTWPQVAAIMGGVTYQRAYQISRGE